MNALAYAWRSLVRQPARAVLGVLGVAAVGALLFDMLLLSEGLVLSMRDLLDRTGYDIRVTAGEAGIDPGPLIDEAVAVAAAVAARSSVRSAITMRVADGRIAGADGAMRPRRVVLQGIGGEGGRPWTRRRGRDPIGTHELVLNDEGVRALGVEIGSDVTISVSSCSGNEEAPPPVTFRVVGVVRFPFDGPHDITAGLTAAGLADACGTADEGVAHAVMVASRGDAARTAADISTLRPDLRVLTTDEAIGAFQAQGFSYFRQISTVLTTVTVSFALLLIAVLLTVSVNQRLGEIAALRALGFSRRRVVADVLCESAITVGIGGGMSLPLGTLLAVWLDGILKRMPDIPTELHFFVYRSDALLVHVSLLAATALLAALYPMATVARLPIAATLRNEVVS
jgi:putative ABC transport system permease protein